MYKSSFGDGTFKATNIITKCNKLASSLYFHKVTVIFIVPHSQDYDGAGWMLCALVLKQSVKHFPNRADMIYFWLRVDQDVIHRSKHLLADHVMKDIVNKLLEYSRTIAQAKWPVLNSSPSLMHTKL